MSFPALNHVTELTFICTFSGSVLVNVHGSFISNTLNDLRCNKRQTHTRPHLSHAVGEQEPDIVAHLSDQRQCLLVVVLGFATEARDEVTAEAHL